MRVTSLVSLLAVTVLAVVPVAQQSPRRFDVVLTNGRIVDGSGAPWFRGDIGIVGDRIAAIGPLRVSSR